MKERLLTVAITCIFLIITIFSAFGNGEDVTITSEDLNTPLKGEPKFIETDQSGNLIIVSYDKNYGISLINRNDNTIEHFTEPVLSSNEVHQIHYNEDNNVLFAVTSFNTQSRYTTLEIIWLSNDTVQKVLLNYYAPSITDLEYNALTNTLYLACNDGLWIIDVDKLEITDKLNKDTGLLPGGVMDIFQEPSENLLWFVTAWTGLNMNIQTLDMTTNTISTTIFNVTDITIRNGYTPNGPILSFLYDTTTRDIFVGFQFNDTATGDEFHLACFDRDDTSKFVPLPTGFLTTGEEITRSNEYHGFMARYIYDIYPRNNLGDGPFFLGNMIGLFHLDTSNEKMSDWVGGFSTGFELRTFLEPGTFTSTVYDVNTDEHIDVELTFMDPKYDNIADVEMIEDSTKVVISNSEGVTITDTEETKVIPKPDPKRKSGLIDIQHKVDTGKDSSFGPVYNITRIINEKGNVEKVKAEGVINITYGKDSDFNMGDWGLIGKSILTITDSDGKVVLTKEGDGRSFKTDLELSGLKSSEYTIKFETYDWLGNKIAYQETKFILENENKDAESDSDSKLSAVVLPIFGGLCGILVLGIVIAAILVFLSKKKMDEIPEETKDK